MSAARRIVTALLLSLSTLLLVGAFGATSASAAPYTGGATLGISDACVSDGASQTLTGSGFVADSTVSLSIGGDSLGSATADSSGAFSTDVTFPALSGDQTVTASGSGESATVNVSYSCNSGGTGGVSDTGVRILVLLSIATALLITGVVAAAVGRRRRIDA
jgi:hypothetical protein